MDGFCTRAVEQPLELTGDGRTVVGLLAPYNEKALVDDGFGPYYETFMPGCFGRCIPKDYRAAYLRVQLEHNGHWVGRGDVFQDGPEGLAAELRLDDTEAGREAAYKIRDSQTPGLSLAFMPGNSVERGTYRGLALVKRRKVKALHHVALCQEPAYKSAQIAAVRSASPGPPERLAYWKDWTERVRRV